MRLAVFSGSPRGKGGNTQALIEELVKGFEAVPGNTAEIVRLRDEGDMGAMRERFAKSDMAVLAFPLYVDAMPSVVMEFIEALEPLCGRAENPALGFMVISGFPEAVHASYVSNYLQKLAGRLGCRHMGTVTMGNAEGIRHAKGKRKEMAYAAFRHQGENLASAGEFDAKAGGALAGPFRFSSPVRALFTILGLFGVMDSGWNRMLKVNGAFERRFDRPDG
jgi:NAD(P)H-dependent FMN reductase